MKVNNIKLVLCKINLFIVYSLIVFSPLVVFAASRTTTVKFIVTSWAENIQGTISFSIQSGAQGQLKIESFPVASKRGGTFKVGPIAYPGEKHPYLYAYGTLIGTDQSVLGYLPLTPINLSNYPRQDLIELNVTFTFKRHSALLLSFPLYPNFHQSLKKYPVESSLICTKILLQQKWIVTKEEWQRITSDYLAEFPRVFRQDNTLLPVTLRYLQDYGKLVNEEAFDQFYVEFLLKIKKLGLGGTTFDDQTLDDVILSSLNEIFSTRLLHTYSWASNAIRDYRNYNPKTRCYECIKLSNFLMNSLEGALTSGSLSTSSPEVKANIISFMQAVTLCATEFYVDSKDNANPLKVNEAAKYLWNNDDTKQFVKQYMSLFEKVEGLGWVPRKAEGPNAGRIREINKYYWWFLKATGGES